jgi:hypothetical protein
MNNLKNYSKDTDTELYQKKRVFITRETLILNEAIKAISFYHFAYTL